MSSSNTAPPPSCCPRPHQPALYHADLEEIFPNVWFVQGTVQMKGAMPLIDMTFQRAMTIVRNPDDDDGLVLFNTLRLDEPGLRQLDTLGTVKHIVRLAYFHGMDDPFYKERYPDATVWTPCNAPYFPQFHLKAAPYFVTDQTYTNHERLPFLSQCQAIVIESSKYPEAVILWNVKGIGKIVITGDALQNFPGKDPHANCCSSVLMYVMGFYKPYSVGPAWFSQAQPDRAELVALLDYEFDHVLPAHGVPCLGKAYEKYAPSIRGV